jgi:hypothetical protein
MQALHALFQTQYAPFIAVLLIVLGLTDLLVTRIPSLPIPKRLAEVKARSEMALSDSEKVTVQKQLQSLATIKAITTAFGIALIMIGFYGLTR